MTERRRYRLTGGIFLVALAFVLLPMLFDGRGLEQPVLGPVPDVSFSTDIEQAAPERHPAFRRSDEPLVDPEVIESTDQLRDRVDADARQADSDTRTADPILREAPAGDAPRSVNVPAWGVQLASFSERQNAEALRDRLRTDGYQAVLSEAGQGSGRSTRVAIGPIMDRDDAIRLQQELADRYQLAPIVVEFAP